MNKKSALTLGSIGGVLVILIIIIAFVMTGQHKTTHNLVVQNCQKSIKLK